MAGRVSVQASRRAAHTLVELAVVIAVLGIVAALGAGIVVEAGRVYSWSSTNTGSLADAQYALDRLSAELMNLAGPADITGMDSDTITFSLNGQSRTFDKSGSDLVRGSNTLATGVSAFTLTYYKSDGTIAASPAEVRRIAIELAITRDGQTVRLRTEVFPRALRDAYTSWAEE